MGSLGVKKIVALADLTADRKSKHKVGMLLGSLLLASFCWKASCMGGGCHNQSIQTAYAADRALKHWSVRTSELLLRNKGLDECGTPYKASSLLLCSKLVSYCVQRVLCKLLFQFGDIFWRDKLFAFF